MFSPNPLVVNNAPTQQSVWKGEEEKEFRRNVIRLQKVSKGNPGDPQIHPLDDWQARKKSNVEDTYRLPLAVEQRIADDLAYVIAKKGEAKSVSAAALEQHLGVDGLTIRISANDGVGNSILSSLRSILDLIEHCAARNLASEKCTEQIYNLIIKLNRDSLRSRMQTRYCKISRKFRAFLGDEIQKLIRRLSKSDDSDILNEKCGALCSQMTYVISCSARSDQETRSLKTMVKLAHELCTPNGQPLDETLRSYNLDPVEYLNNSTIRQIHKIGRYWGLCVDLVRAATRYRGLFKRVDLQPIRHYQAYTPNLQSTVDEKVKYHVHAEVQLLLFYDSQLPPQSLKPRVLGTSKAACFLCNLFLLKQDRFYFSKTHGKLYHQWTFPNLKSHTEGKFQEYRQTLLWINSKLAEAIVAEEKRIPKRPDLMESFVHLPLKFLPSATASDAGTALSHAGLPGNMNLSQGHLTFDPVSAQVEIKPTEASSEKQQDGTNIPNRASSVPPSANSTRRSSHSSVFPPCADPDTVRNTTLTASKDVAASNNQSKVDPRSLANDNSDIVEQENQSPPNPPRRSSPSFASHLLESSTKPPSLVDAITGEVTAKEPFYAITDALHLIFEIDSPLRGFVQISRTAERNQKASSEKQQQLTQEREQGRGKSNNGNDSSNPISPLQETEIDIASLQIDQTIELSNQSQHSSDTVIFKMRQPNDQSLRVHLTWS